MFFIRMLPNKDIYDLCELVKSNLEEDLVMNAGEGETVFTVNYPASKMQNARINVMDDNIELDLNDRVSVMIGDFGAKLNTVRYNPTNVRLSAGFQRKFIAFMMERFTEYADEYRIQAMQNTLTGKSPELENALKEIQAEIDAKKLFNL